MLMFDIIMWLIFAPILFMLWLSLIVAMLGVLNKSIEFASGIDIVDCLYRYLKTRNKE